MKKDEEAKIVSHLSAVGIVGNLALTIFKMTAGILGHSGAMISDAVHSMSDIFATFIAFLGVRISRRTAAKYREELGIPSSFVRRQENG